MAQSIRSDLHAPTLWKAFAASTAVNLHDTDAPAQAKGILPAIVIFNGGAAGGNAVFTDAAGTTTTYALAAGQMLVIGGVHTVTVANACPVLAGWNPEP